MTQTTFTDNVEIQGSRDIKQLNIKGHSTQAQPLETWQNNAGDTLAEVVATGDVKVGDLALLDPTRDALVEAHRDSTSTRPKRGLHSLGRITNTLGDVISWIVAELELLGTVGVSGLQTAFRAKLTHNNTGDPTNAELRAGDFQAINQTGTSGTRVKQITGVRGTGSNATSAYGSKAVGVEATVTNDSSGNLTDASAFEVAAPTNAGTIANLYGLKVPDLTQGSSNYALHTGAGPIHLGDFLELAELSTPGSAPSNFLRLYAKSDNKLYTKDSAGTETQVGSGGGSGSVTSVGLSASPSSIFDVSGSPVTSSGTLALSLDNQNANTVLAGPTSGGAATPSFRSLVDADVAVSPVLAPLTSTRNVLQSINDVNLLIIRGMASQTQALQKWQDSASNDLMKLTSAGLLGIGAPAPVSLLHAVLNNATINAVDNLLTLDHSSTGTVANGLGAAIDMRLESSTTEGREAGRLQWLWNDKTDASRKADVVHTVFDTAEREFLRARGSGSAAQIGFLGATPVARQTVSGGRYGNAALASFLSGLAAEGLITDSTTDSGVLGQAYGGTGQSSYSSGDLLVANDSGNLTKLAKGSDGQVLTVDSTANPDLKWATPSSGSSAPTGAVTAFAGSTAPSGWLLCDGSAVSRTTYAALFGVVSTTYGAGDGSTTFNLPDLRGRTTIGVGQGTGLTNRPLGQALGEEQHTLTTAEMPSHTHTTNNIFRGSGADRSVNAGGVAGFANVASTSVGGGGAHNNMQPFLALNYIIKT